MVAAGKHEVEAAFAKALGEDGAEAGGGAGYDSHRGGRGYQGMTSRCSFVPADPGWGGPLPGRAASFQQGREDASSGR
jgi:hypothetical protein